MHSWESDNPPCHREVVLDTELTGRAKNLRGKEVTAFEARTSINSKDWCRFSV